MYLFFDTETGGLTPDFSLLTLSAIVTDKDFNIVRVHDFDPGLYVAVKHLNYVTHPRAMAVNKIDLAHNNEHGFSVQETAELFEAFVKEGAAATGCRRLTPAGHNVPFDMRFMQHWVMKPDKWDTYFTYHFFDTCASARLFAAANKLPGGCSLDNLRKVFGIDTGTAHNAENDNLATIAIAKELVALVNQPGVSAPDSAKR